MQTKIRPCIVRCPISVCTVCICPKEKHKAYIGLTLYFRCPDGCSCLGLAVDCSNDTARSHNSSVSISQSTRMLDYSFNPEGFQHLSLLNVPYLIFLNLSACSIYNVSANVFASLRNLNVLDLSHNSLRVIASDMFIYQTRLKRLILKNNVGVLTISPEAFTGLSSLKSMSLTMLKIDRLSRSAFAFLHLEFLDLTNNVISEIEYNVFEALSVDQIYINGTVIEQFSDDMFKGLESLNLLVTDNFIFCCIKPYFLPEKNCFPHKDEFSSCSDLMRNGVLRSLLWVIGLFALIGNALSLIYHVIFDSKRLKLGYGMFVSNLAVSDFVMGVYLIIIAAADMYYRGEYSRNDDIWRNSGWCQLAGILASLSSEASVIFIFLITLDRFLVVKYPFGEVRISKRPAKILSMVAWIFSIVISVIPLIFHSYFKGQFYSKSGVCLALPLTKTRSAGWMYSVCVFIGFNFVALNFIIFGQWLIYREVKMSKKLVAQSSKSRRNDLRVARNLLLIATTDFLCWFPIGILGKYYKSS